MSDLNISLILRLVDKATAPARAAFRGFERLGGDAFRRHAATIQRGTQTMTAEFSRWNRQVRLGATILGAYGLSMTGLAVAFIRPAAQFERFNVQLTTLEGSAEGAKRAMSWIEDFATRTPLEMDQTVAAYAKLKAFGLDPTTGALQAAVDTMAATGGGAEQLDGIVLALGQSWTKQKLQGEEAMQLLERGVPVWDLLAKKLGKNTAQVQKMAEKGKLGRKEIKLLIDAMGEANRGASDNMSRTWDGIISNLMDYWTKFQRMVMASGVFDYLKGRLQAFLTLLNQMAADGRLQMWADRVASAILAALKAIWAFGEGVVSAWTTMQPYVQGAIDLFGGLFNVLKLIVALNFARSLWTIAAAFGPVGIAIAAVATAGVLIYENWDKIVAYFSIVIEKLKAWFAGLKQAIIDAFSIELPAWMKAGGSYQTPAGPIATADPLAAPSGDGAAWRGLPDSSADGGRALGGPVRAGRIYRWQENGLELFSPRTDGSVISAPAVRSMRTPAARVFRMGDIVVNAAPGQSAEAIAKAVRREMERLARAAGMPLHDGGAYAD